MARLLFTIVCVCVFCSTSLGQQFARTPDRKNATNSNFNSNVVQIKWKVRTEGKIFASPIVADGILYIGSCDGNMYALDKDTGALLWKYRTDGEVRSSVAVDSGAVYFLSGDGNFYALDAKKGNLKWKYATEGEQVYDLWDYFQSSPAIKDGTVFFGSGDHHVYALNALDGSLRWRYKTGGIVHASPALSDGAVLIGSFDGYFYCFEEDGSMRWKFDTIGQFYFPKGEVQFNAAVSDGTVYFGARDFNLYALNIKNGSGHWVYHQQGSWVSIPSVAQDRLIASMSDSYTVLVLDRPNGDILHTPRVPLNVFSSASVSDSSAYFGAIDGVLYHLALPTGTVVPIFQTPSSSRYRTDFFDSKGVLRDDLLSLYNNDFMEVFRAYYKMGSIFSTVWVDRENLYLGSTDGFIYALE